MTSHSTSAVSWTRPRWRTIPPASASPGRTTWPAGGRSRGYSARTLRGMTQSGSLTRERKAKAFTHQALASQARGWLLTCDAP